MIKSHGPFEIETTNLKVPHLWDHSDIKEQGANRQTKRRRRCDPADETAHQIQHGDNEEMCTLTPSHLQQTTPSAQTCIILLIHRYRSKLKKSRFNVGSAFLARKSFILFQ